MNDSHENNLIADWADLISDLSQQGKSVAIGIFDTTGQMLDASPAMCYFLDADCIELKPKNRFVNPEFSFFLSESRNDLVFEGLITIGNYSDTSFVLQSKVFRKNNCVLVYAEADVSHLFDENKKMSVRIKLEQVTGSIFRGTGRSRRRRNLCKPSSPPGA